MYTVTKRNGKVVDFDLTKIRNAVEKAFVATDTNYTNDILDLLALRITADSQKKIVDGSVHVEDIQDSAEKVLEQAGYTDVAKAYILYRKQREKLRNVKSTLIDYKETVDKYMHATDWRVKENSTVNYSLGGLILSNSGAVTANYWLSEIYDDEIADAHRNADIHIHDLSMLSGYCAGWSLKQLIKEGLGGVPGKITSAPAKHLSVLCNQMVNFIGILQNEWAGAQAFSSFDTYLAPFVKTDNLSYPEVKKCIESFVYGVNVSSRWGSQAPFSNITLDWTVPDDLAELPAIVGGKEMDFCYKDCKKEMDMVNKAFLEVMIEGDANGRGFQYPIPTYSITNDFDWSDTENNRLLFEMTAKYGTPYFSNYINSDMKPSDCRSMCPLRGDQHVLVKDKTSGEFVIKPVAELYKDGNEIYTIILNGSEMKAKLNRFEKLRFYKIRTINGTEVIFSSNHLNMVRGGKIKRTDELTTEDFLPFNIVEYDGAGFSYEDGYLVGAFIALGSLSGDDTVIYTADETNSLDLDLIRKRTEKAFGSVVQEGVASGNRSIFVRSRSLRAVIEDHVYESDKSLAAKVVGRSLEFRHGILSALLNAYGSDDRISLMVPDASSRAIENFVAMLASMGIPAEVVKDQGYTIYTYCIDEEDEDAHYYPDRGNNDFIPVEGWYSWFRIDSIEPVDDGMTTGYCFEVLGDDGPYFMLPSGLVTHNCRLRLDLRELRKKSGGYFGSGESTGSIGVVTINMPRIAYLAKDEADFYHRLDRIMDISARSLDIKRKVISKLLDEGLYPYTKRYLGSFHNHFSTIGLVGMNEAGLNANWLRKDMSHKETQEFTIQVLKHMRERLSDYQEQYGDLFNLEATPAESTAYRLAKHDRERYPDIITAGKEGETPYYTNSSNLPVGYTEDVFDALDLQDEIQTLYTSGTVFHVFLGEKLPDWKAAANMVRTIAENYRLPYYTMSPTYSICPEHGYLTGEQKVCPKCGKVTEVWSRITGYYRPVQNWNDGKVQEFKDRKEYALEGHPFVKEQHKTLEPKAEATAQIEPVSEKPSVRYLFTTKTCPNCQMAKRFLKDISYIPVDAEENPDMCRKFKVMTAPTLVVDEGDESEKFELLSAIKKYADTQKV